MKVRQIYQKATKVFFVKDVKDTNGNPINFTGETVTATIADFNGNVVVTKENNDPSIAKSVGSITLTLESEDTNLAKGNYTIEIKVDLANGLTLISQIAVKILPSNTGTKALTNTERSTGSTL